MSAEEFKNFQLTGRQDLVRRSLVQTNQQMAELYESALRIFKDGSIPSRLVLAAHLIRELTRGLPRVLDLPIPTGRLMDKVNDLKSFWVRAVKGECHREDGWVGVIDGPLKKLLQTLEKFFLWHNENRSMHRDLAARLFRRTDPSGLTLPETLEQKWIDAWHDLHRYFEDVNHGSASSPEEFSANLEALEQMLLDTLYRQPSEDLSAIDRILKEGEPGA